MLIREATTGDWTAIWPFFHEIVAEGETFTYPLDLREDEARDWWLLGAPNRTVVAVDDDGTVLGTAKMNRNHMGNGSHIASASYMVDTRHSGRGVGRALCEYTIDWARTAGFRAMQFNAVVETNSAAVGLYRSLGFEVLGTLPEGFSHPEEGVRGAAHHAPSTLTAPAPRHPAPRHSVPATGGRSDRYGPISTVRRHALTSRHRRAGRRRATVSVMSQPATMCC